MAVSTLLVVLGLWVAAKMLGDKATDVNAKSVSTIQKLNRVETALTGFMILNGRLPCPADGQYPEQTANFGTEAATPGTCTGGTPAAPLGPDAGTGYVVGGTIPTKRCTWTIPMLTMNGAGGSPMSWIKGDAAQLLLNLAEFSDQ